MPKQKFVELDLHDHEAEQKFLSAILSDNDFFIALDPGCFTTKTNKEIYTAISSIIDAGQEANESTLGHALSEIGYTIPDVADTIMGLPYEPGYNAAYFADRLRIAHRKRMLYSLARKLAEATFSDDTDQIERLRTAIAEVERRTVSDENLKLLSTEYLLTVDWPEPKWLVADLLPAGLAFLAGRPKAGKSWLSLQLARAIAAGQQFLGHKTTATKTLYIALEDSPRRLAQRMKMQRWPKTKECKFMLAEQFASVGLKSLPALTADYGLIFVDTFTRSQDRDQFNPSEMKAVLDPLQSAAMRNDCAVVFLDHMPKGRAGRDSEANVIDDVFGTVAKTGVADTIMALYRDASNTGILAGTGRDVMEFKFPLSFDNGLWLPCEEAERAQYGEYRHSILEAIIEAGELSQQDIELETGLNRGSISKELQYLERMNCVYSYRERRRQIWQATVAGRETIDRWESSLQATRTMLETISPDNV